MFLLLELLGRELAAMGDLADLGVTWPTLSKYKKNWPRIELSWPKPLKSAKLDKLGAVSFFGQL
jgi:hypothetical protein